MKWASTILVICVCALLGLGMVMLYSASTADPFRGTEAGQVGARYLIRQLIWCLLGLIGCAVAACLDYRKLRKLSPYLLLLACFMLLLVYVPHFGISVNGGRRWFGYGSVRFQPSEFARLALIIFLAYYCEHYQRQMSTFKRGIVIPGAFIGVVVGLIFIEPDRGCAVLLSATTAMMLVVAGVRLWYVVPPAIGAGSWLAYSLWNDPMRMARIMAWLHPEESKDTVGFQAYQAMIALGSGGWTGLGLGNGRQKLGFVPEHHTDFIFSIIGEELGLIATLAVVITFVVLVVCAAIIARRASDTFGMLLGGGITFIIGLQAFINIGVVTSTLPNKGMPLPFISYGGSNLLMLLIGIGLLLSISRFGIEPEKKGRNPFDIGSTDLVDA